MTGKRFKSSKLISAIRDGRLNAVIEALDDGCDIEEADMHGQRGLPLRTACFAGNIAVVRELLEHGANPNASGSDGPSAPLRLAVRCRHQGVVALLIKQGANIPEGLNIDPQLLVDVDSLNAPPLELAASNLPQTPSAALVHTPPPEQARQISESPISLEPIGDIGNIADDFEAPANFGTATTLLSMEMLRLNEEQALDQPAAVEPPAAVSHQPQPETPATKPTRDYASGIGELTLEPLGGIGNMPENVEAPTNFGTATTLLSMEMLRLNETEEANLLPPEKTGDKKPSDTPLDFTL